MSKYVVQPVSEAEGLTGANQAQSIGINQCGIASPYDLVNVTSELPMCSLSIPHLNRTHIYSSLLLVVYELPPLLHSFCLVNIARGNPDSVIAC